MSEEKKSNAMNTQFCRHIWIFYQGKYRYLILMEMQLLTLFENWTLTGIFGEPANDVNFLEMFHKLRKRVLYIAVCRNRGMINIDFLGNEWISSMYVLHGMETLCLSASRRNFLYTILSGDNWHRSRFILNFSSHDRDTIHLSLPCMFCRNIVLYTTQGGGSTSSFFLFSFLTVYVNIHGRVLT